MASELGSTPNPLAERDSANLFRRCPPPHPISNTYAHQSEVFAHKQNNSDVFVASGLYSVVNKFQFSHSNFFFDKDINERISITVLYKETGIFGKN